REGFYYMKSGSTNGTESILLVCPASNYGLVMIMNNQSDSAEIDWAYLYQRIENDLIEYPKINAWSSVEPVFVTNPKAATEQYGQLSKDTANYFSSSNYLNYVGYEYLSEEEVQRAISVFQLAISEDPENADLFDSLGEAFFIAKDYQQAKENYEQSLLLNPNNDNAEEYLEEIAEILAGQ
ncbi:MAG: tetratricopeptide repeat protein, partial [Bacteroidota bacterium]